MSARKAIAREAASEMEMDAAEFIRLQEESRSAGTDTHDKLMLTVERESERRRSMPMSDDEGTRRRTCQWPDCNTDITGTAPATKYCAPHREEAAERNKEKLKQQYAEKRRAEKTAAAKATRVKRGPAKKKASRKPAGKKPARSNGKKPELATPKQTPQNPPIYKIGLEDYLRMVPMIRTFKTNEEALAYCEGFFAGRKV
jgi:hypothetical protein